MVRNMPAPIYIPTIVISHLTLGMRDDGLWMMDVIGGAACLLLLCPEQVSTGSLIVQMSKINVIHGNFPVAQPKFSEA